MLKLVHSSTDTALGNRSLLASYTSSLRRNGLSNRQDIMCCIFVPVVDYSTFRTSPLSNRKRKTFNDMPAIKASLAGREESVDLNQFLSVPFALVLQHPNKVAKTCITDRTCKTMVLDHASNVQVFSCNQVKPAYKISSDFIEIVVSRIGDILLHLSYRNSRSLLTSTAFLATRHDSLQPGKFLEFGLQVLRVWNTLTSGQSGESINAKINANLSIGFRKMLNNFIKHQSNVVPTSRTLGYRDRGWTTSELPAPSDIKFAELRNRKVPVFVLEPAHRVLSSLLSALLLERWIFPSFVEERLESNLEMPQRLLRRNRGNFFKPFSFSSMAKFCEDCRGSNVVDSLPFSIGIGTNPEHRIVCPPTGAEHLRKPRGLSRRGVEPESLAHLHKNSVYSVRANVKKGRCDSSSS